MLDSATKLKRKLIDIQSFKKVFSTPSIAVVISMFFVITFSMANIYGTFALLGVKKYHFTDMQNGYLFGIVGFVRH